MSKEDLPNIIVFGAGAVGSYFGGMLARAGLPVLFIGRENHVQSIKKEGLFLESINFQEHIHAEAATSINNEIRADIILLCVKTTDTIEAMKSIVPVCHPDTVLLSLQNGVDNVEQIYNISGIEAIPAVVYVAAEMVAPGHVKHSGRGDLIIGTKKDGKTTKQKLQQVASLFTKTVVPCAISENIEGELWKKLIMNCAYNAISALTQERYGKITQNQNTRTIMTMATEEILSLAKISNIQIPDENIMESVFMLGRKVEQAISSTAQDIARGKRTEIDSLNGYIVRLGEELKIETPVNKTLYALVKLLEEHR